MDASLRAHPGLQDPAGPGETMPGPATRYQEETTMSVRATNPGDVHKTLHDYLMENSGVAVSGAIDPEENLLDSGILDSLGIAEVTEFIEKEFGIAIDEDEITSRNYKTLNALTNFCHSKITAAAA